METDQLAEISNADQGDIVESTDSRATRVLLVDDFEDVLKVLRIAFESAGYEVLPCSSVDEALAVLADQPVDVILTDIAMEGQTGIDLLREVKEDDPDLPVLLMTGYADVSSAREAVILGAEDYIVKPVDPQYALHCVKRAAEKRQLIIEKQRQDRLMQERLELVSKRLRASLMGVVRMLRAMLREKYPYRVDHGNRVAALAERMARKLGLNSVVVSEIKAAAVLLDVGMVAVGDRFIQNPLPMTQRDRDLVNAHVQAGRKILANVLSNQRILQLVACHHERWDGRGPMGLSGTQIPVGARILYLCDTYLSMIADWPYRASTTVDKARVMIRENAGRHFDPDIVDVLLTETASKSWREEPVQTADGGESAGERPLQEASVSIAEDAEDRPEAERELASTAARALEDRRVATPQVAPIFTETSLREKLDGAVEMGATSFVAQQVISLCARPNAEMAEVARFASQDPAIASRILRVANSAMYSRGTPVSDLSKAVGVIGMRTVGELVTGMVIVDQYGENPDNFSVRPEWFWEHCVACGVLARALQERAGLKGEEDLFLAGLFHDIGRAVLDQQLPDEYHPLLQESFETGARLDVLEKMGLSMTHADVSSMLLEKWGLERFAPLVQYHHKPLSAIRMRARRQCDQAVCVALANAIVKAACVGFAGSPVLVALPDLAGHLDVDLDAIMALLDDVVTDVNGLKACFLARSSSSFGEPYGELLLGEFGELGKGLFVGSPSYAPDEVEVFMRSMELVADMDDENEAANDHPRFAVCRMHADDTWQTCFKRLTHREKKHQLEPLPVIAVAPDDVTLPENAHGRKVVLTGVPASMRSILRAIRDIVQEPSSESSDAE